jgi:thiamine monophosphate synthase
MAELYLLTPPKIDADFADVLARTLDAGRVSALQLRLKEHSDADIGGAGAETDRDRASARRVRDPER